MAVYFSLNQKKNIWLSRQAKGKRDAYKISMVSTITLWFIAYFLISLLI